MEKPSTEKPMNVLKTMVFLKNFMNEINNLKLKKDDGCFDNEYGDCKFFKKDSTYCLECKINRIQNILKSIKFK